MAFKSPNEMLHAAQDMMLDGRTAQSRDDWAIVMNFMAANIHRDVAESACLLLRTIYDMPLSCNEVQEIVNFQLRRKEVA